jgi:hypothetical protein
MLASARLAFRLSGPELVQAFVEAIRTTPQPPYGRPANASGRTAAAIRDEASDDELLILGPLHAQTLITGRGPTRGGAQASAEPLRDVLAQWAQDKRIALRPGQTYKSFGRLLAFKIHRQGTALYRLGTPSRIFSDILTPQRLDLLKARIAAGEQVAIATELRHALAA